MSKSNSQQNQPRNPISTEDARRIQSSVDRSGGDESFKSRATSAAVKNERDGAAGSRGHGRR